MNPMAGVWEKDRYSEVTPVDLSDPATLAILCAVLIVVWLVGIERVLDIMIGAGVAMLIFGIGAFMVTMATLPFGVMPTASVGLAAAGGVIALLVARRYI